MLNRIVMTVLLAGLIAGGTSTGAKAQQPISSGPLTPSPSGWSFDVAPYVWMPTIGSALQFDLARPAGATVSAGSEVGFGDILSHLNFATMIAADARYDRFSVVTNSIYLNLGGTATQFKTVHFPSQLPISLLGALQTSEGLNMDAKVWTLAGGYTVV